MPNVIEVTAIYGVPPVARASSSVNACLLRRILSKHAPCTHSCGGIGTCVQVRAAASDDTTALPTAATCTNELRLPPYTTLQTLLDKMNYAMDHSRFERT